MYSKIPKDGSFDGSLTMQNIYLTDGEFKNLIEYINAIALKTEKREGAKEYQLFFCVGSKLK